MLDQVRRQSLLAGRVLHANAARLGQPMKLNLALTYWCQYKCKTCNIWRRKPEDELTTEEVLRLVEQNAHVSWADITGGEIFLRPDIGRIFDAIATTWRDLYLLHFPTNGFLTLPIVAVAERLAESRVPHVVITVSVDGDQALNDEVRGITGGFERQMQTLNALRRLPRIRAVAGMTVSRFNAGQVERTFNAIRAACPGLEASDFHVNFAQTSDHYYANKSDDIAASKEAMLQDLEWYRAHRGPDRSISAWLEGAYLRELDRFLHTRTSPMRCHSLRSSCFIDPWGIVYPCITYSRPLGSLRETDMRLDPIWNGVMARRTQHEIWEGSCPQCWTACEAYQSILGNLIRPAGKA